MVEVGSGSSDSYDAEVEALFDRVAHYVWRCPIDLRDCDWSVKGMRFGYCYRESSVGQKYLGCPRFDASRKVLLCRDGLPCNKFVEGFGFGACRDKDCGYRLRENCIRYGAERCLGV